MKPAWRRPGWTLLTAREYRLACALYGVMASGFAHHTEARGEAWALLRELFPWLAGA